MESILSDVSADGGGGYDRGDDEGGAEAGDQLAAVNGRSAAGMTVGDVTDALSSARDPFSIELTFLRYVREPGVGSSSRGARAAVAAEDVKFTDGASGIPSSAAGDVILGDIFDPYEPSAGDMSELDFSDSWAHADEKSTDRFLLSTTAMRDQAPPPAPEAREDPKKKGKPNKSINKAKTKQKKLFSIFGKIKKK